MVQREKRAPVSILLRLVDETPKALQIDESSIPIVGTNTVSWATARPARKLPSMVLVLFSFPPFALFETFTKNAAIHLFGIVDKESRDRAFQRILPPSIPR
jgi:hypothetical protein